MRGCSYPGEGCGASGSGSTAAGGDRPRSSLRRMFLVASTVARSKPDHWLRAPSSSGAAEPRERRPGIRSEMLHRALAAGSPACRPLSAAGRLSRQGWVARPGGKQPARCRLAPRPRQTMARRRVEVVVRLARRRCSHIRIGSFLLPRTTEREQGTLSPFPAVVFCVKHDLWLPGPTGFRKLQSLSHAKQPWKTKR